MLDGVLNTRLRLQVHSLTSFKMHVQAQCFKFDLNFLNKNLKTKLFPRIYAQGTGLGKSE